MSRTTRALAALALGLALPGLSALDSGGAAAPGPFVAGRWSGSADLGEGLEELVVRVVEPEGEGGRAAIALVDLPGRSLFGYPAELFSRDVEGMRFSIAAAGPGGGSFVLRGSPPRRPEGEGFAVEGTVRFEPAPYGEDGAAPGAAQGAFILSLAPDSDRGEFFAVGIEGGSLAGSLLLPDSARGWKVPVALILAGAGEADRDGNNYNVPGKAGSLALLSKALRERGVASLRYDKRGVGESLASAPAEPSFDDYVDDASRALGALAADPRFSRVVVVGHAEGALVGAAALARASEGLGERLGGLAALCASGETAAESLSRELSVSIGEGFPGLSEAERGDLLREATAIIAALREGTECPEPGPLLADFFSPEARAYLATALRYDIRKEVAAAPGPLLVVGGGADLQVPRPETELLLEARPDAAYRVVEGMSHALKAVGEDEEANYESFVDPAFPLGEGLAELVAAFVRGEGLPGADPRGPTGSGAAALSE